MLWGETAVRENIRNREGKRVFYLGKGDQLTASARDYLSRERIEILPADKAKPERWKLASGGYMDTKPEHMTHLNGDTLVPKTHPRIAFRGAMDTLESELLLCAVELPHLQKPLGELLALARALVSCDVLETPVADKPLCGLSLEELRNRSHRPQDYYGQPHFMPDISDGKAVLLLNRVRCVARRAERKAVAAMPHREDMLRALNRMSSMLYILMIQEKKNSN